MAGDEGLKMPKLSNEHLSPHQKQRDVLVELAAARETMKRIKNLNCSEFSNEGVTTRLPYPALDHVFPGPRPGKDINFVGRRNIYPDALRHVLSRRMEYQGEVREWYEGVIITGPKGSGKSCLTRAITCELIATLPKATKVVCFWYFNAFRSLHRQVQDALLFTYCEECEVEPQLAEQILQIEDVEALKKFLVIRKDRMGEEIYVVSDGEERLDRMKSDGSERAGNDANRRMEARKWLDAIIDFADFEVKALSPNSEEASCSKRKSMFKWKVKELFQKGELQTFLGRTILGRLLEKRQKRWDDVLFFAGAHPLSLWMLVRCCEAHVLAQGQQEQGSQDWIHLFDRENWSAVLANFRCGEPFNEIRDSMRVRSTDDLSEARQSFSLGGGFCSEYIHTVYMEAAAQNSEARKFRCPELTGYVNLMLSRGVDFHNWSALGWACETFMGDAILKVGLAISGMEQIKPNAVVILYGGQPTRLNVAKLKPGESRYWSPARYSFKYIDGMILNMDREGIYHLIALQDTVDPEKHRKTEWKFMQRSHVQKWWPSLETIQLHYVYICPKLPQNMDRSFKVEKGQEVVKGYPAELEYFVHIEAMADCVRKMRDNEYDLLRRLADAREEVMEKRAKEKRELSQEYRSRVCESPEDLQKMHDNNQRPKLEEIARSKGIMDPSRRAFRTKLDLVKAIFERNC